MTRINDMRMASLAFLFCGISIHLVNGFFRFCLFCSFVFNLLTLPLCGNVGLSKDSANWELKLSTVTYKKHGEPSIQEKKHRRNSRARRIELKLRSRQSNRLDNAVLVPSGQVFERSSFLYIVLHLPFGRALLILIDFAAFCTASSKSLVAPTIR